MAKVNYKCIKIEVLFKNLSNGDFFIRDNKLYLKVNDISAFDFEENELVLVGKELTVFLKNANDIEITVR